MLVPIPEVHIGLGSVVALLSVPLALRMVPMNARYGIRVRKAFASERNWYELNAYGGRVLLALGLFLVAVGILGRPLAPPPASIWAPVYLVVPLAALVPVIVSIRIRAARLPD